MRNIAGLTLIYRSKWSHELQDISRRDSVRHIQPPVIITHPTIALHGGPTTHLYKVLSGYMGITLGPPQGRGPHLCHSGRLEPSLYYKDWIHLNGHHVALCFFAASPDKISCLTGATFRKEKGDKPLICIFANV